MTLGKHGLRGGMTPRPAHRVLPACSRTVRFIRLKKLVIAISKMLASRARRKVQTIERPTGVGREQREVVQAFVAAARRGDFEEFLRYSTPR